MGKLTKKLYTNSRSHRTLSVLYSNKKINTLSSKESNTIDDKIDIEFKKINEDFLIKERSSVAYISQIGII